MTRRHSDHARVSVPLPLLGVVDRTARRLRGLGRGTADTAPRALAVLAEERGALAAQAPELDLGAASRLAGSEDRLAYRVAWRGEPAVLKLAVAPSADRRLRHEGRVLQALEDRALTAAPRFIAEGRTGRGCFQVESLLPGRPAAVGAEPLLEQAAALIAPIHASTTAEIVVDARWLGRHVDRPIAQVHDIIRSVLGDRVELARLVSLGSGLHAAFDGRPLRVALTHGDYWLENVLLNERSAPTGIVDWDSAGCAPPAVDALHMVLYARKQARRGPLGAELARAVRQPSWSTAERASFDLVAPELLGAGMRSLAWLYWLRFVSGNVTRHPSLRRDRGWVIDNVALPLRHA